MKVPTKNTTGIHPQPGYTLVEIIRDEDVKPLIILPKTAQAAADEKPFEGSEHVCVLEHSAGYDEEDSIPCGTRILVEPEEQVLIPSLRPRIVCIVANKAIKATVD